MKGLTNFLTSISQVIDKNRIYTDDLRCMAWGTDAGFYRLMPQAVIRSKSENEMSQILKTASQHNIPVTFRAAGTSLSGQAISDSVLVVAGKHWEGMSTDDNGQTVTQQPEVIGSKVNDLACLCSSAVLVPEGVGCCGFAGDKGMTHPELNAYALRKLRSQIVEKGIEVGYSNSRTCEIGLQTNSGIPYRSIVYLVNA